MEKNVPLIVIDVQKAFHHPKWGERNNPEAEKNIERLINAWRETNRPIIFVAHISERKESLFYREDIGSEFQDFIRPMPEDLVIEKSVNSAFIGTNLEEILINMNCPNVIICGLTTNHCVETTTRMAGNFGFNPVLVSDAAATFDRVGPDGKKYRAEDIHQMTLVNLNEEFAEIVDTETLIKRLVD
ncbi:cysteine hydrolase family protein [Cytobacillus sp. FJAT-54145]|uniref:Cysteine hydrolase family protein n=1 Tax=Cytobacillus spartinae TaxID=3299023 RepID=A0ABW6KHQ3_9BACI